MGKRASNQGSSSSVKVARAAAEPEPVAKELPAGCDAACAVIARSDLSEEARSMMQAMLPFCFGTPASERHVFQRELCQELSALSTGVLRRLHAAVDDAEASLVEASDARASLSAKLEASTEEVGRRRADCDGANKVAAEAAGEVSMAQSALATERASVEGIEISRSKLVADLAEHEELIKNIWLPLKTGAMSGSQWRKRNEEIRQILEVLTSLGVDDSLLDALPVALKAKPEARGGFAAETMEFAESMLRKHSGTLAERSAACDAEAAKATETVRACEAKALAAKERHDATMDAQCSAENAFCEADSQHKATAAELSDRDSQVAVANATKARACSDHTALQALVTEVETAIMGVGVDPAAAATVTQE